MKHFFILLCFFSFFSSLLTAQTVVAIKIDGTINPVAASFIHRAIEKSSATKAQCLIIYLNTPGGLLQSTRVIVSDLLEAPIPVVVYIAPGGAHAGSAGVFITLAAHIAAMAPGTNIGAAHPVDMQGERDTIMNAKATNDAVAFIHTIAETRNRNWQWAEEAVRYSVSITENEALKQKIIDVIAPTTQDLLKQIDSKNLTLSSGPVTLHTKGATIQTLEMGMTEKLLDKISDPNIAYVMLLLGMLGVLFELFNPGAILPGIVGGICLILAFYSMHTLPINYAGLALIVFSIILFLLEIKIASHGLLAIGGSISLLLGSMMLIRPDASFGFFTISRSIIFSSVFITALFFVFVIGLGLKAQRSKPVTGVEGLIGDIGESLELLEPNGTVRVHGEIWQAESKDGKINKGEKVRVIAVKDLKVHVEHFNS